MAENKAACKAPKERLRFKWGYYDDERGDFISMCARWYDAASENNLFLEVFYSDRKWHWWIDFTGPSGRRWEGARGFALDKRSAQRRAEERARLIISDSEKDEVKQ